MSKKQEVTIEQYRETLSNVCDRAVASTEKWIEKHPDASRQDILDATYKITQVYGLAASTLAANKYDQDVALAEKQGFLKPGQIKEAEVWDPLGYGYIAKAINGTIKNDSKEKVPETVGRMVKQFAEDTTLKNANRDGAEYAWIPGGDSCVFCLSLAANGWQRASKKTAEGNHADHIHPHCDCTFSVRFSKETNVKGYHPEKIKAMIESQEGDTWNEKLNSLRRQMYSVQKTESKKKGDFRWPEKGIKITIDQYKEIRKFAQDNDIILRGVKGADLDVDLVKEVIADVNRLLEKYHVRKHLSKPFEVDFSHSMQSNVYAETFQGTTHVIYFNKDAYRNKNILKEKYKADSESGHFVKNTNYRAITYHELGHIIQEVYGINPLGISKEITGMNNDAEVLLYVKKELSDYSGSLCDGSEIIAECFSALESGIENKFALKFVEKCVKIIEQGEK